MSQPFDTANLKLPVVYRDYTPSQRRLIRLEYVRRQNGLCHHCKAPLENLPAVEIQTKEINLELFPDKFMDHPVHLHHDHNTGLTIGAVHSRCNAVLWQYHGK